MHRRAFVALTGAALTTGCAGFLGNAKSDSTPEPSAEPPKPEIDFRKSGEVVRVVHMGGEQIGDSTTEKVVVKVNEEVAAVWASDEEKDKPAYDYPISIGNYVEVEATSGDTVSVVWHAEGGETTEVLAEYTVE
jgi:hypothetical protein